MKTKTRLFKVINSEIKLYNEYPTKENKEAVLCIEACSFWTRFLDYYMDYIATVGRDIPIKDILETYLRVNKLEYKRYVVNPYIKGIIPDVMRRVLREYEQN